MESRRAISIIRSKLDTINDLLKKRHGSQEFTKWHRDTEVALERIFGPKSRHKNDFTEVHYSPLVHVFGMQDSVYQDAYTHGLNNAKAVLASIIEEIEVFESSQENVLAASSKAVRPDSCSLVELICFRFHTVARQLLLRHSDRPPLAIEDEYDAQYLFHALLKLHFDDVRAEEWTPSYAGGASRIDFLLKDQQIIIELKKTRESLKERDIGEQLIVDISKYRAHPGCKALICFVYDPEGIVANPVGLEKDLESNPTDIRVRVIVAPKTG